MESGASGAPGVSRRDTAGGQRGQRSGAFNAGLLLLLELEKAQLQGLDHP